MLQEPLGSVKGWPRVLQEGLCDLEGGEGWRWPTCGPWWVQGWETDCLVLTKGQPRAVPQPGLLLYWPRQGSEPCPTPSPCSGRTLLLAGCQGHCHLGVSVRSYSLSGVSRTSVTLPHCGREQCPPWTQTQVPHARRTTGTLGQPRPCAPQHADGLCGASSKGQVTIHVFYSDSLFVLSHLPPSSLSSFKDGRKAPDNSSVKAGLTLRLPWSRGAPSSLGWNGVHTATSKASAAAGPASVATSSGCRSGSASLGPMQTHAAEGLLLGTTAHPGQHEGLRGALCVEGKPAPAVGPGAGLGGALLAGSARKLSSV